jgi:ABC-type sugar transport system substrate-binding protein
MKKTTAVILTLLLVLSLFACGKDNGNAEDVVPSASEQVSADPANSESPSAPTEEGTIGYLSDNTDHFNREPYKIGYICYNAATSLQQAISMNLEKFGTVLNYDYNMYSANMDYDAIINQMQVYAGQDYDGLIVGTDESITERVLEVGKELNIPFVAESTPFRDENGNCIWPSVAQDQYNNGADCVQWLADNYKNYWTAPIDESTLGLIVLDFTVVQGIHEREPGAHDRFAELFPAAADNYWNGDLVTLENGFSVEGGNKMTSTIMSAHPEITKWFVVGLVDDWSVGATRAIEALNKQADALVVSVQADAFVKELESGGTGDVYVAASAISPAEFASYMALNLVTILEGRATAETIWPEWVADGSQYACVKIRGTMVTKDTYQEWQQDTSFEALTAHMNKG